MKKSIFILIAVVLGTVACNEQIEPTANNSNSFDPSTIAVENRPRIKIKTGRPEIFGQREGCTGKGACGPCLAICITIEWEKSSESVPHSQGWREAEVNCDGNFLTLSLVEQAAIDNGDGTTSMDYAFSVGAEVSSLLGYNDIVLQPGTYTIDYSSNSYGNVTIPVTTN